MSHSPRRKAWAQPVKTDIVVVGAGPAGLMAAIAAAQANLRVVVCERLDRAGAKLVASGGGRCNFCNTSSRPDFAAAFGRQGRFVLPAWDLLDATGLRRLLDELGVPSRAPDGFHVFPASNRSRDVLASLMRQCAHLGVEVRLRTAVGGLRITEGHVRGVETPRGPIDAQRVVVAAGGKGYPDLGGSEGGYALARQAGHTVTEPVPALVPLLAREAWPGSCSGVTLPAARVSIDLPRYRGAARTGAVLFTHGGLSGPAALDLSGEVAALLCRDRAVPIRLELLADEPPGAWRQRLDDWQRRQPRKCLRNLLAELLPQRLAAALAGLAGDVGGLRAAELPRRARDELERVLTAPPLTVTGTAGFGRAMVTRGGVALKHVDPRTLASRLIGGLHFAGEVLDLDAPSGGYNLHWALASGHLAGMACRPNGPWRIAAAAREEPADEG